MSRQSRWSIAFNCELENAFLISLAIFVHELVFIPFLGIRKLNKTPQLSKTAQKESQNWGTKLWLIANFGYHSSSWLKNWKKGFMHFSAKNFGICL